VASHLNPEKLTLNVFGTNIDIEGAELSHDAEELKQGMEALEEQLRDPSFRGAIGPATMEWLG
jgi:hypothetical protein